MGTIEVPHKAKVEKVASLDRSRPVLSCIHLQLDADGTAYLEATDSYSLVRVPVGVNGELEPGYIPVDALKAARKNDGTITLSDGTAKVDGVAWPVENPGKFPDCAQLIPDEAGVVFSVTLNPRLLMNMGEAFGAKLVTLEFQAAKEPSIGFKNDTVVGGPSRLRAIRVTSAGGVGVLMPAEVK